MIPTKIDSMTIVTIREKGLESVIDWFDQHKQSLYALGSFFHSDQRQIEELFYRSISKVHKELSRFKQETSFDVWVTAIFLQACREFSRESGIYSSEPQHELHKAFDQLKDDEKEAMVLRYVNGFSQEEVSHILQVSLDQIKEYLFSGTRSFRKHMGYELTFTGCTEYHHEYIDYLERTMDRPKRIDFEVHIYHCERCQDDLATFQDVRLSLLNYTDRIEDWQVPPDFMKKVRERLLEEENQKRQKSQKRRKVGFGIAGVFALLMSIGVFTGAFANVYYSWTEDDEELRAFLQQDLGQRLNLAQENDGVKVTIKGVVADDVQTLVFYEIEDTNEDNQYFMNYDDGVTVENVYKIMSNESYPRYYPPNLESDVNKSEKNVYQGKISMQALQEEEGTINLKINKLMKLNRDVPDENQYWGYGSNEYKTGEWSFEIPVTKQPSVEYELSEQTTIEGIPVRFEKLIIAPTITSLQFGISTTEPEKRIEFLQFKDLEVNHKIVKSDPYGSTPLNRQPDMNWFTFQAQFDSLLGEKPKKVSIQLESAYFTFEDDKMIELDYSQAYPQTFEYAGSTISIDKVEVGLPTTVVVSDHEVENRAYESLHINVVGENENEPVSMGMETEGVIIDRNGKKYDMNASTPFSYEEIEQPRHFITVNTIRLDNKVIPKRLEIFGYNTTKYLNDIVELSLEK